MLPIPGWQTELRTLETMLQDRNYTQLRLQNYGEHLVLLASCRDTRGDLTFCYLSHEGKVGVRTLRKMRADAVAAGASHVIFLSQDGFTPFAQRELVELGPQFTLESFRKRDLAMPVVHHRLVPKHEPLSRAQKQQLLLLLGCKARELPKLKESDPVAKYLHLLPGTVVRITRRIGTLESEPYFRVVV